MIESANDNTSLFILCYLVLFLLFLLLCFFCVYVLSAAKNRTSGLSANYEL